jgi:hypothetical protein
MRFLQRTLTLCVALCGFLSISLFLLSVAQRLNYPLEFDLLEGGMLEQVRHVSGGKPLYAAPSLSFVAFIYGPLYTYLAAWVGELFGVSFHLLRTLSLIATFFSCVALFLLVRHEKERVVRGFCAVGLFLACYPLTGFGFDQGRVDSLFLAFLLWALVLIREKFRGSEILSAALFALAFFTKQIALIPALLMIPYLGKTRQRAVPFLLSLVIFCGGGFWLLNSHFVGWYRYYCFDLPAHHDILPAMYTLFWSHDLASFIPVPCLFALLYFVFGSRRAEFHFAACALMGLLFVSWVSRIHTGGVENVLAPAYAGLAFMAALAIPLAEPVVGIIASALVVLQFAFLPYRPSAALPSEQVSDRQLKASVWAKSQPGEVFIPYHPYLAALSGKKPLAHQWAIFDVMRGDAAGEGLTLSREVESALSQKRFSAIIGDDDWYRPLIEQNYELKEELPSLAASSAAALRRADLQPRLLFQVKP